MRRALSPQNILDKKIDKYGFKDEWLDAFGNPGRRGVWFVWGNSGSGKTSFLLQLSKYLCTLGERVIYNSLEEEYTDTIREAIHTHKIIDVNKKMYFIHESIDDLILRLRRPKSPKVIVIDSIQYCNFSKKTFFEFVKEFEKTHTIIFNSQCQGKDPIGNVAVTAKYHASLKIWCEGYRAISHGRYFGSIGYYTIYAQRAAEHWLEH